MCVEADTAASNEIVILSPRRGIYRLPLGQNSSSLAWGLG